MGKLRFNWKIILYVLSLVLSAAAVIVLLGAVRTKSNEQACKEISIIIAGEEAFVEQHEIADYIEQQFGQLVGRTLNTIPTHEIEAQLNSIPYIKDVVVNTDLDGSLAVRILQRKAVLRVINETGLGFYVDENRLKMPVSLNYVPRVIVANGHILEKQTESLDSVRSDLVNDLFDLAEFITRDSLWSKQIVQLYVNENREIELIPKIGNQRILFGNATDVQDKFDRLAIFYKSIVPKVGLDAYASVSLKYADQLVCERGGGVENAKLDSILLDTKENINSTNIQ